MSDQDLAGLMSRVALGDRGAFGKLYSATSPKLFAVCMRMMRDRHEAEEALQEIFIRVWQKARQQVSGSSPPEAWLVTVARNHCIDRLRAKKPFAVPVDEAFDLADDAPGPEKLAERRSEAGRIETCMEELDFDRAEAVRGAYLDGLSYQELADKYSVPLNTMRTWLRRSLLRLRDCLGT
ncbi:sigma-70 family RNA polymerase sigma factor [Rhizobium sp. L1K21]|uniref:sigma-70 family RNA polymerase sigma factor n=1 Tax=Rhizobium sp. L1K21 TaxID=2954933 RepID=UPI0020935AC2|nr:sigma-70 family RNA polymerase sigma factor [Rhizobium sp. L1K21]MCO6185578.1 sigma-70 family RNA polymerase sigma factor [Rhizobium sp. L1K21]